MSKNPYRENDNIPIPITKPAFWIRHGLKLAAMFFVAGGLGAGGYSVFWKLKHPAPCQNEVKQVPGSCDPGTTLSLQDSTTQYGTTTKIIVCTCKEPK
jgi:hypothetical protein